MNEKLGHMQVVLVYEVNKNYIPWSNTKYLILFKIKFFIFLFDES
jgi:hypothetical protein